MAVSGTVSEKRVPSGLWGPRLRFIKQVGRLDVSLGLSVRTLLDAHKGRTRECQVTSWE